LALLPALLSIDRVSSAIIGVAEPAELIQTLQRVIAGPHHTKILCVGEVASALSNMIIDPAELHFFAVDQARLMIGRCSQMDCWFGTESSVAGCSVCHPIGRDRQRRH
jgi:hypothetical protein